jgi:acetyl esterase/lipase
MNDNDGKKRGPRSLVRLCFALASPLLLPACSIAGGFTGGAGWNTSVYGQGGVTSFLSTQAQTTASLQNTFSQITSYVQTNGDAVTLPQASSLGSNGAAFQSKALIQEKSEGAADTAEKIAVRSAVPTLQAEPQVYYNIDFTSLCGSGNYADLYIPGTAAPTGWNNQYPLVVIVHGGAWSNPARSYMGPGGSLDFVTPALYNGMAVLNVDYGPDGEQDLRVDTLGVMCQITWMRTYGSTVGVSNRAVVAIGHSAGGHIVALLDAMGSYASGGQLNGAVVLAGISDLSTFYNQYTSIDSLLTQTLLGTPTQEPTNYAVWSATGWESTLHGTGFSPIQWWAGTGDTVVPDSQCQEIVSNAATGQGTVCNLVDDDHSFLTNANTLPTIYQQALGQGAYVAKALGVD